MPRKSVESGLDKTSEPRWLYPRQGERGTGVTSLFSELRRRNVFRVAASYVVVGWLIIQAVSALSGPLNLPEWFTGVPMDGPISADHWAMTISRVAKLQE